MVSRYIPPDIGPSLRLKALLGSKWNLLQPGEHPLGAGRQALDKFIAGRPELTDHERVDLAELKKWASVIDRTRQYWCSSEDIFAKDLLTAAKCRSLLFEIDVIHACIEPTVRSYEWPIYREGARDVQATGPDMVVECKLAGRAEIQQVIRGSRRARSQARPVNIPLVVAVGFEEVVGSDGVRKMASDADNQQRWFRDRPEISAVIVMMRTPSSEGPDWNPLSLRGRTTYAGQLLEIRNQASLNPLPLTFSFGGATGVARIKGLRRN